MPHTPSQELDHQVCEILAAKVSDGLRALSSLNIKDAENTLHVLLHNIRREPAPNILGIDVFQKFSQSSEFLSLFHFVCAHDQLKRRFLDTLAGSPREKPDGINYVKASLVRALAETQFDRGSTSIPEMIASFVEFLQRPNVEREVHVGVLNLDAPLEPLTIADFGTLRGFAMVESKDFPRWSRKFPPDFMFTIKTPHLLGRLRFPFEYHIRFRMAFLRIAIHPLIAFNSFQIQHIHPWEEPVPESVIWNRFWGRHLENRAPQATIDSRKLANIEILQNKFRQFNWDVQTPWRLAINRLDDAVFKLESGSPDAILDLGIGLESIYADTTSRQESTHKVATRAARYLAQTKNDRLEIFHRIKKIYASRSTLAHGQNWKMDERGLAQVIDAAELLGRTLRKMTEEVRSDLDLVDLDLN
jgi:hypothetical protein